MALWAAGPGAGAGDGGVLVQQLALGGERGAGHGLREPGEDKPRAGAGRKLAPAHPPPPPPRRPGGGGRAEQGRPLLAIPRETRLLCLG